MRIVIANNQRSVVGGVETYLREIVPELLYRGHDIGLLCEQSAVPELAAIDEQIDGMRVWDRRSAAVSTFMDDITAWKPDVIYVQGLDSADLEEAIQARFPAVMFAHTYHGTCISGSKRHAFPVPRPCARVLGPGCLLLYYPRRCGGLNPKTMWESYWTQRRRQGLLQRYRQVAVASRHMVDEFRRHGVAAERLHHLPLFPAGMVPDPAPPTARTPSGVILMVGRLTDLKGGTHLMQALPHAARTLGKPLSLVVAGEGTERANLESLAMRHGVRADFVGWVAGAERERLMRQADLVALPSVWPEPFGLVGIEAGCVGVPAVGYAVGGIPDWLVPGESGELAPGDPPTATGLAEALIRALGDRDHFGRLRRGAWEMAQRFTLKSHVDGLERILTAAAG